MAPAFSRRTLLAAVPASLAACAAPRLTPPLPHSGTRLVLTPVDVASDRIIRIDVGLRPFRPAGFVARNEIIGDKMIVHNYGHGGGGVTLSWGTAALALEQAPPVHRCAVLGCGAVGLATARLAQERGMRVTIYAATLPPETTSNVAGAQWWPSYVYDEHALTPAFRAQFVRAAHFAYRRFQALPTGSYGKAGAGTTSSATNHFPNQGPLTGPWRSPISVSSAARSNLARIHSTDFTRVSSIP